MKKIYGFLAAAALLSMAACTKEDVSGPEGQQPSNPTGDLFMTMNIAHKAETRTATPNQGYEVGKDYENAITSALLIFAKNESGAYKVFASSGNITSGDIVGDPTSSNETTNPDGADPDPSHSTSYKASFSINRQTLLGDIATNGTETTQEEKAQHPDVEGEAVKKFTYTIFVVANPTSDIIDAAKPGNDVQQIFAKFEGDGENGSNKLYWEKSSFLMSSANVATKTIYSDEIALGTHTTKPTAYNLGKVYVQRAMSRFDLATKGNHMTFVGAGDNENNGPSEVPDITVKFDAVAMINMAKSAYLFKVMGEEGFSNTVTDTTLQFGDERETTFEDWWVFSPDQQNSYFNQLFTGLTGTPDEYTAGTALAFESFFENGKDFTLIGSLNEEDNTFEHPQHQNGSGDYRIWRYCMENTNADNVDNQKNGNSTGVVFRAQLTGGKIPTTYEDNNEENAEAIYAYGNVVLGTAEQLKEYATNPKAENDNYGVYEAVRNIYNAAVKEQLDANKNEASGAEWDLEKDGYKSTNPGDWFEAMEDVESEPEAGPQEGETPQQRVLHYGDLADLDTFLVKEGFFIYRPKTIKGTVPEVEGEVDVPAYYCYYLYWNRHNDNGQNTIMGKMEFATVRNNVYKLSVNKILNLGHPGQPDDDPYTPDPDDPDEKDTFWLEVECEILPWEVRVNNIEF